MKEKEYLSVVPGTVPTRELHGFLLGATAPRPIAFASTISPDGTPNLAPFSFFNVFSSKPPMLIFSPARRVRDNTTKHTLQNILQIPEVVVNVVSYGIVEQMNLASSEYAEGVSEFEKAGFTALPSDLIRPFRVAESPVQMECKVVEVKPLSNEGGGGNLIFCKVLKMHLDKDVLDEDQRIDPHKINLVGRMGGAWYSRTAGSASFQVPKPPAIPGMGVDALPASVRMSHVLTGNDLGKLGYAEALPGDEAVESWWADQHQLPGSMGEAHDWAHAWIREGDNENALLLLLGADKYLEQA